jgi:periplasmic protein CpxP/Spy
MKGFNMAYHLKRIVLATLGGIFAIGTLGALSGCGGRDHHGWHNADPGAMAERQAKMVDYASRKLDLNETQKKNLNNLADKLQQQRAALVAGQDPRSALQGLVAGDKLDKAKAQAFINDKTGAIQAKSPEVVTAAAEFYDSLNPAQQQQVRDLLNRRSGWMRRG